jgi:hypothetical protein
MGWDPQDIDKIKAQASEWTSCRRGGAAAKKKESEGAESTQVGEGPAKSDAPPEGNAAGGGADKDKAADKDNAPAA